MRALFVIPSRSLNGAARALVDGGVALAARDHTSLIATPVGGEVDRCAQDEGLETQSIVAAQGMTGRATALRALIVKHFVDVVFTDNERDLLSAAIAVRWGGRGVVVRRVGAGDTLQYGWRTRLAQRLAKTGFVLTDARPETNAALAGREVVEGSLGVRLPDVAAEVGQETDAPQLTCVSGPRDGARDALGEVLRAFALLRDRFPNLRLVVLGGPDASSETSARLHAAALRVATAVEWRPDPFRRATALGASTLGYVAADGDDGIYGVLDLMAHGVPFVARRTPLVERYASAGIHGALLPTLDPARAASELAVMLSSPERRLAMGTASRTRVARDFNDRVLAHPFEQIVRQLRGKAS